MSTSRATQVRTSRAETFVLFQRNRGWCGFQSDRWMARAQGRWCPGSKNVWPSAKRAFCSDGATDDVRCKRRRRYGKKHYTARPSYWVIMLDEELFHCFASRAEIKGKSILIDIEGSKRLKEKAVFRGFTTKSGIARKNLTTWDWLVIVMRDATSGEPFNHEWWAAELTKPNWLRNLETLFGEGWLYFPMDGQRIDAK